ncbi:hypothetical protein TREAZ_1667 [Leadbettera azotonutricia ZAS-9]|uniref:Uncharacterized protein n=1 Tax=Leadbettera azotonutricia (strain ATCC BAA-888 / DSM 13862 / ZAS-9) TaxID=545695 RepID=F5YD90_LEAAZ|nr:hypothetical protein TREAZ_1667 [Leadbettera azotonutricia ZAS-9]
MAEHFDLKFLSVSFAIKFLSVSLEEIYYFVYLLWLFSGVPMTFLDRVQ